MFSVQSSILALALVSSATAAHLDISRRHHGLTARSLEKRFDGQFSYYTPEAVACAGQHYGDRTVALSAQKWDGGSHCGEKVTITCRGKTEQFTIVDECMGCPPNQLDLSEGGFKYFSGGPLLEIGIMQGSWSFGGGGGGGDNGGDDKKEEKKKNDDEDEKKKKAEEKKKSEEAAEKKEKEEKEAAEQKKKEEAAAKKAEEEKKAKKAAEAAASKKAEEEKKAKAAAAAAAASSSAAAAAAAAAPTPAVPAADVADTPSEAEPTEALQAVGGVANNNGIGNGAGALHVAPSMALAAILGAAFLSL